jgi:hypothetical protein
MMAEDRYRTFISGVMLTEIDGKVGVRFDRGLKSIWLSLMSEHLEVGGNENPEGERKR